jgi:hypothetical protein
MMTLDAAASHPASGCPVPGCRSMVACDWLTEALFSDLTIDTSKSSVCSSPICDVAAVDRATLPTPKVVVSNPADDSGV